MVRLPELSTDLFAGRDHFRFWIGVVATGDGEVLLEREFRAARQLRANCYIDVHGFLPEDARQADGQEIDEYDDYAQHHVVLENLGQGRARAIGTDRLVFGHRGPLPCERLLPDHFPAERSGSLVFERSRVIAASRGRSILTALNRSSCLYATANGFERSYGLVEPWFLPRLREGGLVARAISPAQMIDHFNAEHLLIELEPSATLAQVTADGAAFPLTPYLRAALASGSDGFGYAREADLVVLES